MSKQVTKSGATVTITKAVASATPVVAASALPTVATLPIAVQAAPVAVAVRGGPAITSITLNPAVVYRTQVAHNTAMWEAITKACASGPQSVAALVSAAPAGQPMRGFIGYVVRKGYAVAV